MAVSQAPGRLDQGGSRCNKIGRSAHIHTQQLQTSERRLHRPSPTHSVVMQASSVCRKLQSAASNILKSSGRVCLSDDAKQCQLGSSLLRKWAIAVRNLSLDDHSLDAPGLIAFLEANDGSLKRLRVACHSMLASSMAEHLMPCCRGVSNVLLSGSAMPGELPAALTHLKAFFKVHSVETQTRSVGKSTFPQRCFTGSLACSA